MMSDVCDLTLLSTIERGFFLFKRARGKSFVDELNVISFFFMLEHTTAQLFNKPCRMSGFHTHKNSHIFSYGGV